MNRTLRLITEITEYSEFIFKIFRTRIKQHNLVAFFLQGDGKHLLLCRSPVIADPACSGKLAFQRNHRKTERSKNRLLFRRKIRLDQKQPAELGMTQFQTELFKITGRVNQRIDIGSMFKNRLHRRGKPHPRAVIVIKIGTVVHTDADQRELRSMPQFESLRRIRKCPDPVFTDQVSFPDQSFQHDPRGPARHAELPRQLQTGRHPH